MLGRDPAAVGRQGPRPVVPAPAWAAASAANRRVRATRAQRMEASAANLAAMRASPRLAALSRSQELAEQPAAPPPGAPTVAAAAPARSAAARWLLAQDGGAAASSAHQPARKRRRPPSRAASARAKQPASSPPPVDGGLDGSALFSPPASPGGADSAPNPLAQLLQTDDLPPSPGPPPEHMPPERADRISLRSLRHPDGALGGTIDDVYEPQTVCHTSPVDTRPPKRRRRESGAYRYSGGAI